MRGNAPVFCVEPTRFGQVENRLRTRVPSAARWSDPGALCLELVLRRSDYLETWWSDEMLRDRGRQLLGFSDQKERSHQAGLALAPSWLTLLGPTLTADLDQSIVDSLTSTVVGAGLCLRAAQYPPVGVTPDDIGQLPTVARLLRTDPTDTDRLADLPDHPYANPAPTL